MTMGLTKLFWKGNFWIVLKSWNKNMDNSWTDLKSPTLYDLKSANFSDTFGLGQEEILLLMIHTIVDNTHIPDHSQPKE